MFNIYHVILSLDNKMFFGMLVMVHAVLKKVLNTVCLERLSNVVKYVKRKKFVLNCILLLLDFYTFNASFFLDDDDDDGQSPGQKCVFYNTGLTTLVMPLVCTRRCSISKVPVFELYRLIMMQ